MMTKRIFALLLALLTLLTLISCNEEGTTEDTTVADTTAAPEETTEAETDPVVDLKEITLGGVAISEFKIVYAKNPDPNLANAENTKLIWTDYEFDKLTAEYLRDRIKEEIGVELEVVLDSDVSRSANEINIGATNRGLDRQTTKGLSGVQSYAIKMLSGKLSICGLSYAATYQAVDALIAELKAQNLEKVELAADYSKTGKAEVTIIACMGDSLTYGSTSTQPLVHSYPAVLGRLLWKTAVVYNYGLGGRTMTDAIRLVDTNPSYPKGTKMGYMHTTQYKDCLANAQNFDIALIMLGTNDANTNNCTPSAAGFEAEYIAAYKGYVDALKAKNANVKICLMNCPFALNATETNMATYLRPIQKKAAEQVGTDHFDMFTYSQKNIGTSRLLPDDLHPSEKGYEIMAKGVLAMLTEKYGIRAN